MCRWLNQEGRAWITHGALRGRPGLRDVLRARPELADQLRIHFLGADCAPRGRAQQKFEPLARELGLGEIVSERTDRLPYFEALRSLRDTQALLVPGSDDAGYTASMTYPYVLAPRPLLAVFHRDSSSVTFLEKTKAGEVVQFWRAHRPGGCG